MAREMKDSGIEWIGQIPERWDLIRLENCMTQINEKNTKLKMHNILSLSKKNGVTPYEDRGNQGNKSKEDLSEYKEKIASLGHSFNVDIEVKKIDDNVGKKTTWTTSTVVGENVYYSVYTDTVENAVYGSSGKYTLKEGDIISVTATNTDVTIAQSLRNAFYAIAGKGTYQISGSHSGVVQNNGTH